MRVQKHCGLQAIRNVGLVMQALMLPKKKEQKGIGVLELTKRDHFLNKSLQLCTGPDLNS